MIERRERAGRFVAECRECSGVGGMVVLMVDGRVEVDGRKNEQVI